MKLNYEGMLEEIRNAPLICLKDDTVTIPKKEYEELLKAKGKAETLDKLIENISAINLKG